MPAIIFISYSHQDAQLVEPTVSILRGIADHVFQDVAIRPGKVWKKELEDALRSANLVVLFWCHHSATSDEVRKEIDVAMKAGKDVLPVLLDETPLPPRLAAFQRVDFRKAMGAKHRAHLRSWLRMPVVLFFACLIAVIGYVACDHLFGINMNNTFNGCVVTFISVAIAALIGTLDEVRTEQKMLRPWECDNRSGED
jgi:hypothetical protein